uniref:Uncharacterized protein n=1 Tax=Arundo donax TaxID=35708 RepID=A0A0A9H3S3_ARUDO
MPRGKSYHSSISYAVGDDVPLPPPPPSDESAVATVMAASRMRKTG